MKKYKKYASSPTDADGISDETSTTRLYAYDLAEVKAMCVDGKTKSDVIRELVRRALYARRYRQASTDPAFKEIFKSFDDAISVRLHHLEERLTARMDADFDVLLSLVGYLYLTAYSGVEELKQVRLLVTPDEVAEDEFMEAWERRFVEARETVAETLRAQLRKRRVRLGREGAPGEGSDPAGGGHPSE